MHLNVSDIHRQNMSSMLYSYDQMEVIQISTKYLLLVTHVKVGTKIRQE